MTSDNPIAVCRLALDICGTVFCVMGTKELLDEKQDTRKKVATIFLLVGGIMLLILVSGVVAPWPE